MLSNFTRVFLLMICCNFFISLRAPSQEVSIQGVLSNGETNEPLPYATLILHDSADSSMVSNALTEVDGSFVMQAPAGNFYLLAKYVGFEDKIVPNIQIAAGE